MCWPSSSPRMVQMALKFKLSSIFCCISLRAHLFNIGISISISISLSYSSKRKQIKRKTRQ